MNKKALVMLVVLVIGISLGLVKFISSRNRGIAGLKVVSNPEASIFLNDKLVGKTPYEDKHPSGEYVLKLVPENVATNASAWQKQIVLNPSLLTYVKRDMGSSELTSGGEYLFMEKINANEIQVEVVSTPENASVLIDAQDRGATPQVFRDLTVGEHDVTVTSPGFISRTVRVLATEGYKLTVNFQLALAGDAPIITPTSEPVPTGAAAENKAASLVTIKDTPTGFLRVRSEPSTSAKEVAKVDPGRKFPLIEEKSGWYKIAYEEGKEGWIASRYAEKSSQ